MGALSPYDEKAYFTLTSSLPDAADFDRHHGLASPAPESLAELGHVLHDTVDPKLAWRVRIGLYLKAELFGTRAAAPSLAVSQKKLLEWGILSLLLVKVNALAFGVCQECDISES